MKRQCFVSIAQTACMLLLVLCLCAPPLHSQTYWNGTAVKDWTGTGTASDPYLISTPEQLAGFAASVNAGNTYLGQHFALANDIWLIDTTLAKADRPEWTPIGELRMTEVSYLAYKYDSLWFRGHFDGKGHTLYNLCNDSVDNFNGFDDLNDPTFVGQLNIGTWYKSLFGFVGEESSITNLHLKNTVMVGSSDIAGMVLYNYGHISDCSIEGLVVSGGGEDIGGGAGGLVCLNSGLIERCEANVAVIGPRGVGSLTGINSSTGVIRDCHTSGYVEATQYSAGGFVGTNNGLVEDCSANVQTKHAPYKYEADDIGGFTARNDQGGIIRRCSASGDVYTVAFHSGGGFAGWNLGYIADCYSTGNVYNPDYGAYSGGFCRKNGYYSSYYGEETHTVGTIINCFATGKNWNIEKDVVCMGGFCRSQDFEAESYQINCHYVRDYGTAYREDGSYWNSPSFLTDSAQMKTQAFVDTLNQVAAIMGTNLWQYNPGAYPTPTKETATSISPYFAGGTGTKEDPWLISTKEHLRNLATYANLGYDFRDKYILQTEDIALNAPQEQWGECMPEEFLPIALYTDHWTYVFRGTYDGGLHTLSNLYINLFTEGGGLFGTLYHNASIRNLGVVNAWVKSTACPGILVGQSLGSNVNIRNCWTSGMVQGERAAGGILGNIASEVGNTRVLNSYSTAEIKATEYATPTTGNQDLLHRTDTVGNFYFAGTLDAKIRNKINEPKVNVFFDKTLANSNYEYAPGACTTTYMHSPDFVNELNAYVSRYNAVHTDTLMWWKHVENNYPLLSRYMPEGLHMVTFRNADGSRVSVMYAYPESRVVPPPVPSFGEEVFIGWYTDENCKQAFDFNGTIVADTTLYARFEPAIGYDLSVFKNPFATSYHIKTVEQLFGFAVATQGKANEIDAMDFAGKTVYLDNDIVVNDTADWHFWGTTQQARPWIPCGAFNGTFEGNNHTVYGIYINPSGMFPEDLGFFSTLGEDAKITNLTIGGAYICGYQRVGALVGTCLGTITNCHTIAHIEAYSRVIETRYFGGLVGMRGYYDQKQGKSIRNCSAKGWVRALDGVGGLVGSVSMETNDTIAQCYTDVQVCGNIRVGGLVGQLDGGQLYGGNIADCYAVGEVKALFSDSPTMLSRGTGSIGGLVGRVTRATLIRCYAAGEMLIDERVLYSTGGLIGQENTNCNLSYCFYDKDITKQFSNSIAVKGTPCSTRQMHRRATFESYDFDRTWGRKDTINGGYPYLRWEYGDYIHDDPDADYIPITSLTVRPETAEVVVGNHVQLEALVLPSDATEREIRWSVANKNYVSSTYLQVQVDDNGLCTALLCEGENPRECIVTATTINGLSASCTLKVFPKVALQGISLPQAGVVGIGETKEIKVTFTPSNATNKNVTWSSSDETVLTVDQNGNITGISLGTATITVTTEDGGFTASQTVTVEPVYVTGVRMGSSPSVLKVGEKYQLLATVLPENATDKRVRWSSEDEEALRVDSTGLLTALAESRRISITVTTADGGYTASARMRVSGFMYTLTDFAIAPADTVLSPGDTLTLTTLVTPAEATEFTALTWQSSRPDVVSVNNGKVTVLSTGEATVTATATFARTTMKATCRITCYPATALPTPAAAPAPPRKVLIDNVLYILLPDGHMYDMMGQKVK